MLFRSLRWNSVADLDLSSNDFYVDENPFTYNYNRSLDPNYNQLLNGYWRGIYKYFYDTDRPHTHPWEMQGFSLKPEWWDDVYGPAPYTSENKVLWESIEQGLINDPTNQGYNIKYSRPGLSKYIPVDNQGNLLSPLDSNLVQSFSLVTGRGRFEFGDQGPVETAWRRSSEYPYAVMITMCVLRGAEFIGKMWDRFTIKRNLAGQVYQTTTGVRINLKNIVFSTEKIPPNNYTITSGLANFIDEYV